MTLVAVAGGKGSPGATTLALALAASAPPEARVLVVEADPAGGDIAARAGLGLDPGLVTLAAAGRRGLSPELVARHTQPLACGARVLLGPASSAQAATALSGAGADLPRALAHAPALAVADLGRWDPEVPAAGFTAAAEHALLVLRPTVEGVAHAGWQLAALARHARSVSAVVVGERPYRPEDVAAALGLDALHVVEDDPRAAAELNRGRAPDRWLARSPLLRGAAALADWLLDGPEALGGAR